MVITPNAATQTTDNFHLNKVLKKNNEITFFNSQK